MLAAWHAGIEWGFWEGFQTCVAKENNYATDLLETLKSSPSAPQCNQASFRFLGLSLASYNSILSLLTSLIISKNIWKKE
jgi:disulfide bond formation protein DsbB|tara:strand:- start:542 stop:781 length:240 start_codon:yes stop_codon:yes gene_type:complete